MMKRLLSLVLTLVMLIGMLPMMATEADAAEYVYVISGIQNTGANTSSTSHKYSTYWQYWSQGASKYAIMRSYGCRVVAQAKMLVELGVESSDINTFNPDLYLEWGRTKGFWLDSETDINEQKSTGLAAITYAADHGVTLEKGYVALSGNNSAADVQAVMDYINAGYYVILSSNEHQAYVGRAASIKAGTPVVLDSWYTNSTSPYLCQSYNGYTLVNFGGFNYYSVTGGTPTPTPTAPSASMSVSEYLSLPGVTVTAMSGSARMKTSNTQTWKLPWTNTKNGTQDASLKLAKLSGEVKLKNKVINHAGNVWYEYETGTGTRGFVYSNEVTLLPYYINADAQNPTTDTVKLVVTWKNPGGVKLIKGGFVLKNSSGTTLKTVTEDVPTNYQTSLDLPCSYEMKTEYGYALKPNTTYTYTMFVQDSNKEKYEVTGTFTTKKIAVTSVAVSPATSSLTVGKTQQLTATVSPSNASNKGVTWKSSNTAVATVSSSGVVTAKGVGTATITATATDGSGKSGTAKITVSCSHSWKGATCTAPKTCSTCGATEGSAKGHTWKAATCTVAKTCTSCGATEGTAKGHAWKAATCTAPKTCTSCGATEGTAKGHAWKAATCTVAKTCTSCGATEGSAKGHAWKAATCTTPKTCSTCGATEGTAKGHAWKAATCTAAKTCSTCGATEGTAKGHAWKAATCTAAKTCSTCGATEGSAKGHSWKEATNTAPKTCTTCGATDTNTTIIASGTFGDNLNWKLDDKGTLTISGQGSALSDVPWYDHRADITTVVIEEGVTNIGNDAFSGCIFLRSIEIPDSVTRIGHTAFGDCVSLTSIKIPDSVTSIRTYAFYQCTSLTSIEIPDGVTNIGEYTFYNCNNLNSIEIPDSVTSIDYKAFADCSNLTEIVIPDSVTNIDAAAFLNCSSLTSISIPKSVTNIGDYAFAGCSYSIDVYYGGTEAEWNALANRPDALYVHYSCDDPQNHWKPNGYDPTCKDKGFTWEECPCDYYVREVVEYPAKGHNWKAATCTAPKTCSTCGATEGNAKAHIYTDDRDATCDNCGYVREVTPVPTEPVLTEPFPTEPAPTEPVPTEPAPTEPAPTEPAPTEPAPSEPKPTEPKPTEPAPTEPVCQHQWQEATCKNPKTCKLCGEKTGKVAAHTYDDILDGTCNFCSVKRENVEIRQVVHMFRMYNPNTGEHFYTGSTVERDNLIGHGWQYEGVGFTFPANMGAPVYRLFHEPTGEHLYTMDKAEKEKLEAEGWNYEGIAFNSAFNTEAVQHRLHNPNATVGAYHFTFSEEEKQNLINAGWEYQGIGWYSCWK